MNLDWTQGALAAGLRCYRAGGFFAAHEEWESVWLRAPQPEKNFLQGVIQVTAAFHHLQRRNPLGARLLLEAALLRLERYAGRFGGIELAPFRDGIRDSLRRLAAGEADNLPAPRIQIVPPYEQQR